MSTEKEVIYRAIGFDDLPPLQTASVADFIFSSPYAQLDDSTAFIDAVTGLRLTRAGLYDLSLRLAHGVDTLGLKHGKGVGMIFSPNSIAWPIVFFGLLSNGVVATLANSSYTPPELAHQIKDSGASLIFVHPLLFPTLIQTLKLLKINEKDMKKRVVLLTWTEQDVKDEEALKLDASWMRLRQLLDKGKRDAPIRLTGTQTDTTTLMCYSSGTTGLSKGVETTHRNILTIIQAYNPLQPMFDRKNDVELGLLPLYHIFGIIKVLCISFWRGVPIVVLPKFEPIMFFKTVEKYKISIIKLVPPILVVLASHPAFEEHDLSSITWLMSGAAPLGEGLVKRVRSRFQTAHKSSPRIVQGYGLTETSPTVTMLPTEDDARKIGSIGVLLPTYECRLVDDDGKDVKRGSGLPGELWLRGPSVMKGYLNNPTATANTITKDGWFKSGDVAVRDDEGFYYIVDRKKELIKYKGFQVPPADLEAVLLTNDKIVDAGVIGVESVSQATELPRAYVVATNNAALLADSKARAAFEQEIQDWIKTKVAKHKFLRGGVRVIEAVPKSAAGKILRRQLRDLAKAEAKEEYSKTLGAGTSAKL